MEILSLKWQKKGKNPCENRLLEKNCKIHEKRFDICGTLDYNTTRTIVRCSMRLSVRKIINTPGEKISFQFSMDLSCVEFGGCCPVAEPVVVTGSVRNMAGVLILEGKAETTLHTFCDRCGKALVLPKTVTFEHMLAQELENEDEADDEIILLQDGEVDVEDLARTAFILGMDTKTLCSEDCKGLCPICGADLNLGSCTCKKEPDPRLAVLAKLLQQDE